MEIVKLREGGFAVYAHAYGRGDAMAPDFACSTLREALEYIERRMNPVLSASGTRIESAMLNEAIRTGQSR
jgi:hypothetical protein